MDLAELQAKAAEVSCATNNGADVDERDEGSLGSQNCKSTAPWRTASIANNVRRRIQCWRMYNNARDQQDRIPKVLNSAIRLGWGELRQHEVMLAQSTKYYAYLRANISMGSTWLRYMLEERTSRVTTKK